MDRFDRSASLLLVLVVLLALAPIGRLGYDWWTIRAYLAGAQAPPMESAEGFDWVEWTERDGHIEATWVFPRGPGADAGILTGDRFFMLEYQQFFDVSDLRNAVRSIGPGETRGYLLERGGEYVAAEVRLARYPTFLYPRSSGLWYFALWAFAVGAFVHLIALFVARPLARRSSEARAEFLLILVSSVWVFGNLLRLALLELVGPPVAGTTFDHLVQGITFTGLVGWIAFPAFLLHEVTSDVLGRDRSLPIRVLLFLPAAVLALSLAAVSVRGHLGPVTPEGLLVPVLFYTSCYIAAAALVVQASYRFRPSRAQAVFGGWGQVGSLVILLVALLAALSVQEVLPLLDLAGDVAAGWIVVAAQLLAVAPVTLFSYGTLRHGKIEEVVSRALVYLTVLGVIFFLFVAFTSLLDPTLQALGGSRHVVEALFVVALLLVADRLGRRLRGVANSFFRTDREKGRQLLSHFQEQMLELVDPDVLCRQTVETLAEALQARSAVLHLLVPGPSPRWVSASWNPEPPYLTEHIFRLVWPHFRDDPRIWVRNDELDERGLPADAEYLLTERGAAVAVPIRGEGESIGLLVLGTKRKRGSVYNLEDMDNLRSLAGQLALAADRIARVEREKELARESSEAQLVALRAQINPHFLFNALNTILSHIGERPDSAEEAVERLAAMFRHTLQTDKRPFVPLESELELIEHYLRVEQARFGTGLEVEIRVDPAVRDHPVPAFIVQTLVENAVKHGIERKRGGGRLTIVAEAADEGAARISVADTGVGIQQLFAQDADADRSFFGIGLSNAASRLALLYGRDDLLELRSDPETGTVATITLPPRQISDAGT
jgi:signal transduction histidine kinase/cobalamin biosynthesis protein CobD/CbiB